MKSVEMQHAEFLYNAADGVTSQTHSLSPYPKNKIKKKLLEQRHTHRV